MSRFWKGAALLGVLGIAVLTAKAAWAERVISDYEASKLTFSALIAPPSAHRYHRPVHHTVQRFAAHHSSSRPATLQLARRQTHSMVRNVAFRGHVISPHSRKTHKRHG